MLDQAERLRDLARESSSNNQLSNKSKIITVTSGKGGVGKSNIIVNLGIQLSNMGNRVLIFDADIGMGNDDVLMGVYPKHNIFDIIENKIDISEAICKGPKGVDLLSGGSGINKIEDMSEDDREYFLDMLKKLELYDYILIDTGAGISRSILAFIACCDELIVITTPEPTSLTDGYSLIKAVNHFKIKDKAYILINRSIDEEEARITYTRISSVVNRFLDVNVECIGSISDDKKVTKAVRNQVPFIINYPTCESSRDIIKIADKLSGYMQRSESVGARGLFKKLFSIFS